MKLQMKEHFQGTGQPTLGVGQECTREELGGELFDWLLEHRKAVLLDEPEPEPVEEKPESIAVVEEKPAAKKPAGRARSKRGRAS